MSAEGEGFPWRRMMELGLGVLRLPPNEFWQSTPREIAAAFPQNSVPGMGRASLQQLMNQFPD